MEFLDVDVVGLQRVDHELGHQGRAVGREEVVQTAASAVIVEEVGAAGREAEESLVEALCPLAQSVERLARGQHVADQHAETHGRRELEAAVLAGNELLEEAVEP